MYRIIEITDISYSCYNLLVTVNIESIMSIYFRKFTHLHSTRINVSYNRLKLL